MAKRRRTQEDDATDNQDTTPRKTRRSTRNTSEKVEIIEAAPFDAETPSGRKSILKNTPSKANTVLDDEPTPKSLRKVLFTTPNKLDERRDAAGKQDIPTTAQNDRSARRKSARRLQEKTALDELSDAEDEAQDDALARDILDSDGVEDEEEEEDDAVAAQAASTIDTPSRTGRRRGRPKGKQRAKSPTPPVDLPPHELYFFQNRAGGNKTSSSTLPSHVLLNHEDYFAQINAYKDPHEADIQRLKAFHHRAFDQWIFELEEGFNLCLYGYGSKRSLTMEFAEHLYFAADQPRNIVVANGYTPGLTIRDILSTLGLQTLPKSATLPAQPSAMVDLITAHLTESPPASAVVLIVHSLDHSNLRKPPAQSLLARLASHTSISLIATCDTPNFPLLWDLTVASQFRFLYHDFTIFEPYKAELDVVEEVNALLGRSGRRLGGKDGVGYVLKSLPENARNLFRILVAEQLALADFEPAALAGAERQEYDDEEMLGDEDDDVALANDTPSRSRRGRPAKKPKPPKPKSKPAAAVAEGVEYRTLYHKAVEEFVCSSELNFRTLLKEFHDHQMIESRKDGLGTERLVVPFRREELESILEELV